MGEIIITYQTRKEKLQATFDSLSTEINLSAKDIVGIDLSSLKETKNIQRLFLNDNMITEISLDALTNCTNLEGLFLRKNKLSKIDLSPLSKCTNLRFLTLSFNQLEEIDLRPLWNCRSLDIIDLEYNSIDSIFVTPIASHPTLKKLIKDKTTTLLLPNSAPVMKLAPAFKRIKIPSDVRLIDPDFEQGITVFLSHSSADKQFVRRLAQDLSHEGISAWVDEAEVLVGESLVRKISEAIEEVDFVVALLSKNSAQSEWVQKELGLAMTREISNKSVIVLPLRLDDCELPEYLKDKLYGDFRGNYAIQFQNLVSSIRRLSLTVRRM